jgi:uncharacterized protein
VRPVGLLSALALLLTLLALPAAADQPSRPLDYTAQAGELSQPIYPRTITEQVVVRGKDGVGIYVEVTRPDPAAYPDLGDVPVILESSVYHGTLHNRLGTRVFPDPRDERNQQIGLVGYFAPRGYAVAMMDLRGTGHSEGCLDHLGPNDAEDIRLVIEHLASRDWSNGRVGMAGHSYVAATQNVAAAQSPRGLVTIIPSAGLASMYDHQFQMGVPYNLQYVGPMVAYELLALQRHLPPGFTVPVLGGATGDDFGRNVQFTGCGLPNTAAAAGTGQVTGQYELWHAVRDWRQRAQNSDVSVFMVHGVNDNAARIPAAEWFFGGRFDRPQDKLWLGQWDHGGAGGRCAVAHPTCRFTEWVHAVHAWFDHELLQRDVDTGPAVEVFLNGRGVRQPGRVWTADSWSRPALTTLHLDAATRTLSTERPTADSSVTFSLAQLSSAANAGNEGPTFTMTATRDMLLVGLPELRLRTSITNPSQVTHLVVEVARRVQGNAAQEEPIAYCTVQPALRNGVATLSPVVPGQVMDLYPQCFTMAHEVFAGDQIVLTVGSRTPHHVAQAVDAQVTVHTGPTHPSAIRTPIRTDYTTAPDPLARYLSAG